MARHFAGKPLMVCLIAASVVAKPGFARPAGPIRRQHIVTDLKQETWTESDPFTRDQARYLSLGLQ